jgi:hypothetical protein
MAEAGDKRLEHEAYLPMKIQLDGTSTLRSGGQVGIASIL